MWFVGCKLQPLRLGACSLCGLFAFAHDIKDGSKFIFWWLVRVLGSCGYFEPRALLVRVLGFCPCWFVPWWLVGWWLAVTCGWCAWWWLPACLGAYALVVGVSLWLVCLVVVTCMPWWFVPWWLVCPWLVLVGGYLCTLELVPWLVLVGSGYLHALNLVPWWLVW